MIKSMGIAVIGAGLVIWGAWGGGPAQAMTIGSDVGVSRFSTALVFPSGANTVLGFARLTDGFIMTDSATTVRWSSFFPLGGKIYFNGGEMVLDQDLLLASDAGFWGNGKITANARSIFLGGDLSLTGQLVFTNAATIEGQGHVLDLTAPGAGLVMNAETQMLTLRNMTLLGLQSNRLEIASTSSVIRIRDCTVILADTFSATTGVFEMQGRVSFEGTSRFRVAGGILRVTTNSLCSFGAGSQLEYGGGAIQFQAESSRLQLQAASLVIEESLALTRGTLMCDQTVSITVSPGQTLTYGNGTAPDNLSVEHCAGARVRVAGQVVNANSP